MTAAAGKSFKCYTKHMVFLYRFFGKCEKNTQVHAAQKMKVFR